MPPARPSSRAAAMPAAERRAAIIEAIRPLLAEHGEAVTTRQIACAAGVAEGTIFRVFTDKDELLDAALESVLDTEPFEATLRSIDPTLDFESRLVAATELMQERVRTVWTVVSALRNRQRGGPRSATDSPALTAIFAVDADRIRVTPLVASRRLRALTMALTHPILVAEPTGAQEIVATLLYGIAAPPKEAG